MNQLPPGKQQDRTRLWDRQYRLIWDSATATEPAYKYINEWTNATIDHPNTPRWVGAFYRCPEGIKRFNHHDEVEWLDWPAKRFLEVI